MTPFMAFILISWWAIGPNGPERMESEYYNEVFPDKQICEVALKEHIDLAMKTYRIPGVNLVFGCVPATGKDA